MWMGVFATLTVIVSESTASTGCIVVIGRDWRGEKDQEGRGRMKGLASMDCPRGGRVHVAGIEAVMVVGHAAAAGVDIAAAAEP